MQHFNVADEYLELMNTLPNHKLNYSKLTPLLILFYFIQTPNLTTAVNSQIWEAGAKTWLDFFFFFVWLYDFNSLECFISIL